MARDLVRYQNYRAHMLGGLAPGDLGELLAVDTGEESLVQQHFVDEVDINSIMRRFGVTGQLPRGNLGGVYGDFTGITDYESAAEAVRRADEGFMRLPADVRDRFGNDPGTFSRLAHEMSQEDFEAEFGSGAAPAAPPAAAAPPAGAGGQPE